MKNKMYFIALAVAFVTSISFAAEKNDLTQLTESEPTKLTPEDHISLLTQEIARLQYVNKELQKNWKKNLNRQSNLHLRKM